MERARLARGLDSSSDSRPLDGSDATGGLIGASPREVPFSTAARPAAAAAAPGDQIDLGPRFRPWSDPTATATQGPVRCQFLRAVGPDGKLIDAQNSAVPAHRCAAFGDPLPLSLRQQELVCLQRVHVSCPRYARGTVLANETVATPKVSQQRWGRFSPMTIIGIGLVILAVGTLLSGLLGLPPFGGGKAAVVPTASAPVATSSASQVALASASPSAAPSAVFTASPGATARPTAAATPTPSATPKPTAAPTATWPPGATAARMSLLTPCAGTANCWVYTVRGPGAAPAGNGSSVADTLAGVCTWFGVNINTVRQMNPGLNGSDTIHPGDKLKVPNPTR
jgi:cytoskeletal protein RodZ